MPDGTAFELLARHHGVPSQLLDWTESPYIASFFAFEESSPTSGESVAVWVFDRAKFVFEESGIDLIDDRELLRFKPRALRQRGVFTRVRTIRQPFETLIGEALTKILLPVGSRSFALSSLDEMMINSATMYTDFDGAARTARSRFRI